MTTTCSEMRESNSLAALPTNIVRGWKKETKSYITIALSHPLHMLGNRHNMVCQNSYGNYTLKINLFGTTLERITLYNNTIENNGIPSDKVRFFYLGTDDGPTTTTITGSPWLPCFLVSVLL